jgi:hypothetical protein
MFLLNLLGSDPVGSFSKCLIRKSSRLTFGFIERREEFPMFLSADI